jgi:phage terminase large subunit-like protein
METITRIKLPRPHEAQRGVIRNAARFNVVNCGRRFGKTILGEDRIVRQALEGRPVAWFAPSYKLLLEPWRDILRRLRPIIARKNATERRVELVTGGVVEFWSLTDPDAARGRKYATVVVDEAAMIPNLERAWNAALRPTLADMAGDAWFLSTPKGMNFFWVLHQRGQDPAYAEWQSWTMPTSANPFIAPVEVEAMRRDMPERIYRQEVLAEFIPDAGAIFRGVVDAATATEQEQPIADHEYVIGVDWGKLEDFTVFTVIDATTGAMAYVERSNRIDYRYQLANLYTLYRRYRPFKVVAERNSMGEPLIEQIASQGIPVEAFLTTNDTKDAVIMGLAQAFERRNIEILNDPVLIGELQAYEAERLPSGKFRYGAPSGMHDDMVMSLALAWYGANNKTEALLWA